MCSDDWSIVWPAVSMGSNCSFLFLVLLCGWELNSYGDDLGKWNAILPFLYSMDVPIPVG